ncbi:MAG: efflux RND transporter periplasmic adaptor subunit [Mucilaginibacter sp.]
MKRKAIYIITTAIVAVVLIWFFFIHKTTVPVVLQTVKPAYGYIATSVTATGRIEPVDTVSVGTQVSGTIQYIYADFNSKVKKGQLLASLEKTLLQATLQQAQGNLLNAQSALMLQKNNFQRQSILFKTDAISKADYDSAVSSYNSAKANVKSAEGTVLSAKKNLSYADVYSPIDGVVLNRNVSVGQTVAASFSTPTLFVIAKDITKMQVQANVDEADIGDVAKGERVSFTVDAFINDQFAGTVEDIRLHPSVSANVVTYTTIINAPNNDMKLKPGMTANIIIYTKEVNNAMLIPAKALQFTPDSSMMKDYKIEGKVGKGEKGKHGTSGMGMTGGNAGVVHSVKSRRDSTGAVPKQMATVWLLNGKTISRKRIQIGLNDNSNVEVLKGLDTTNKVITGVMPTGSAADGGSAGTSTGGSPFLPKRPNRSSGGGGRSR